MNSTSTSTSARQTTLHAALPGLAGANSFRELCRRTVDLGTSGFGFHRMTFWAVGDDGRTLRRVCLAEKSPGSEIDETEATRAGPADHYVAVGEPSDILGYLAVESEADREIAPDDIALLKILANTIGHLARHMLGEETLRELYRITSETTSNRKQRIQSILRMGLDRFDLEIAILARVTKDRYEVVQVIAPPELDLVEGLRFDLQGTFCCETLKARGPLGFTRARESKWATHPCYHAFGLEAYLAAPVRIGETIYGTLNFSSRTPRARAFTDFEYELVQLMGRWVQVELEQERNERRIREHETLMADRSRSNVIGELATSIAHELNQPLSALTTLAEATRLALQADKPPEVIARDLAELCTQAHRASDILRSLRSLIRRAPAARQSHRLGNILQSLREAMATELRVADIEFVTDVHSPEELIEVDSVQVAQVLRNLVQNSIHAIVAAAPLHRRIVVKTQASTSGDGVDFQVNDTGQLAEDHELERLLEPFYTTKEQGLGLGLSICRSVVEAHSGSLSLDRSESGGLTVQLNFGS